MAFPGMYTPPGAGGAAGGAGGLSEEEQVWVKRFQRGSESCVAKSIMAGAMGGALGGAFGLFMSSVS